MGHAGEIGFEWAIKEGGAGGVVGAAVGAILGWPHATSEALGTTGLSLTHYSNAFTSGEFSKVVEAGLFGGGVLAAGLGVLVAGAVGALKRSSP